MIAATHLALGWTVPVAIAAAGWSVWYWLRLGRSDVPISRRRIRRVSLVFMALSLPVFVRALSVVDPQVQQREYIATWMLALALVLIVLVAAGVDAINSLRLHHREQSEAMRTAALELAQAIKAHRQSQEEKQAAAARRDDRSFNGSNSNNGDTSA